MHSNFHWALGIIIASLASIYIEINFLGYIAIVFAAIVADYDIFIVKFTQNKNHRMLISHSIYFPIILFIIGEIISSNVIKIMGISYLSHVLVDLIDWGNNFFYTKKIHGIRLLLKKDEYNRVEDLMNLEKHPKWFFIKRYSESNLIKFFEISIFIFMLVILLLFTPIYWYFIIGYFLTLILQIKEYHHYKKMS